MSVIKVRNITFGYPSQNEDDAFAIQDINFSCAKGEYITLLGPNGSGKSTLLKLISGINLPDKGDILIKDKNLSSYSKTQLARLIAFVPQTFSVAFPFSVYEIVMMGRTPYLNFWGYENKDDIKIVNDVLDIVGISHLRKKGINEVSGGEAQRAFIARALAQHPEILLLDEPNAHLDIEHQIEIYNLLEKLKDEGLTILMVSHDLNLAGYYGERIIFMKEGKILIDDQKKKVLTEGNIMQIFNVNSRVENLADVETVSVNIVPK